MPAFRVSGSDSALRALITAALRSHAPNAEVTMVDDHNSEVRITSDMAPGFILFVEQADERLITSALAAGARAILSATSERTEFDRAIRLLEGGDGIILPPGWLEQVTQPRPRQTGTSLSAREREVLQLVAEGRSNQEIATELAISRHTVRAHIQALGVKLGVNGRHRLASHMHEEPAQLELRRLA